MRFFIKTPKTLLVIILLTLFWVCSSSAQGEIEQTHGKPITFALFGIMIIIIAAHIAGKLVQKLGQPTVLGELFVAIVLGNLYLVGIHQFEFLKVDFTNIDIVYISNSEHCAGIAIYIMSQLGVILLLFMVGLKTSIMQMKEVRWTAFWVAILGVIMPMILGWGTSFIMLPNQAWPVHMFIGATLTATSIGITARVLDDLGKTSTKESQIILGASIVDDVLGLLVLAVVQGIIVSISFNNGLGEIHLLEIGSIIAKAFIFIALALFFGQTASRSLLQICNILHGNGLLLVSGLTFCFTLSWLADYAGLATIVGAFAAGLILDKRAYDHYSEEYHEQKLIELIQPIRDLFVPIFFVMIGIHVDLKNIMDFSVFTLALTLTIVAILGKQICSFGVFDKNINRWVIGIGMIPRGEVGLIFAAVGSQLKIGDQPVISTKIYTALIIMVFATTMITPPMLKKSFTKVTEKNLSSL